MHLVLGSGLGGTGHGAAAQAERRRQAGEGSELSDV